MSRILDYAVITSSKGVEDLETLIKQNIGFGWQPIGGVTIINPTGEPGVSVNKVTFVQAMVKYDY